MTDVRRKTVSLLLALVMMTGLSSCGSGASDDEASSSGSYEPISPSEIEQLEASSVVLPVGDTEGPHPENLTDVRIKRGHYTLPEFEDDPGFEQIMADEGEASEEIHILTDMDDNVMIAGVLEPGDRFSILSAEEDGWLYVESGKVRGFIRDAGYKPFYYEEGVVYEEAGHAEQLLKWYENDAYFYKRITAHQNPAPLVFAVSLIDGLEILEECSSDARVIGDLPLHGTAYVIEDCGDGWLFVESGYVRGFVLSRDMLVGEAAEEYMREQGIWAFTQAVAAIPFSENLAAYHTCTFVDPGMTARDHAREYMQILGRERENELEIPESFGGRRVGWIYSCTPNYGGQAWLYKMQEVWSLWMQNGAAYVDNVAMIDMFYLIACTETYGEVGDYVTFYLDDDTPLHCIIADVKSSKDAMYTTYGHIHNNDIDVIEAETLYEINPGQEGCMAFIGGHRVCSCVNHGKFQPY